MDSTFPGLDAGGFHIFGGASGIHLTGTRKLRLPHAWGANEVEATESGPELVDPTAPAADKAELTRPGLGGGGGFEYQNPPSLHGNPSRVATAGTCGGAMAETFFSEDQIAKIMVSSGGSPMRAQSCAMLKRFADWSSRMHAARNAMSHPTCHREAKLGSTSDVARSTARPVLALRMATALLMACSLKCSSMRCLSSAEGHELLSWRLPLHIAPRR